MRKGRALIREMRWFLTSISGTNIVQAYNRNRPYEFHATFKVANSDSSVRHIYNRNQQSNNPKPIMLLIDIETKLSFVDPFIQ